MAPHTEYYHIPSNMFNDEPAPTTPNTTPGSNKEGDQDCFSSSSASDDEIPASTPSESLTNGAEDDNDDFSAVRKTIRKQQNRASAKRCRQKRKTQMTAIFDMLRCQKKMIQTLEKKVEKISSTLSTRDMYAPGYAFPYQQMLHQMMTGMSCDPRYMSRGQYGVGGMGYGMPNASKMNGVMGAQVNQGGHVGISTQVPPRPHTGAGTQVCQAAPTTPAGQMGGMDGTQKCHTNNSNAGEVQPPPTPRARANPSTGDANECVLQFDGFHLPDFGFYDHNNLSI